MARLIPRKQIEEQQNISSSFSIGQDLNVGNNVIVSGSLLVSQSFFLGTDTGSKSEITGSVYLTGSLSIDGSLNFVGPKAILSATASNALQSNDTRLYDGIRSVDFGANVPTLYVSSTDGDDNNDGRSIQYPLRTIKRASLLATPGYDGRYGLDSGSKYNGYVIRVQAGTYLEDNPVTLPKNSTIWGSGLRITKILAQNKNEDLFWVNSGCYVAEVTVGGLELYPDQINPDKGFGFAFQPGAFITTSPYIQNCSQISNQENSFTELYEDIKPGGGGLYVNGDAVNPDSPLASMVLDAYTQISPNGVGCLVNGRGFIQLVSFFNNFSYYAIRVNNGGHATLNNSNISFGLYGMYASGSRFISGSGGDLTSKQRVRDSWSVIVNVLNKGLEAGLPTITTLNTAEGIRVNTTISQSNAGLTNISYTASASETAEIVSDYNLISAIVENGTSNFPTLLAKSSNKGYSADSPYNILGATQITSSINASNANLTQISASIAATISILNNGTGSYNFKSNNDDLIKITTTSPISIGTAKANLTGSISSSFGIVQNIIKNGLSVKPTLVSNNTNTIYVGTQSQYLPGVSSSLAKTNEVSASFSIIYNVLANGTGSNIQVIPVNHKRAYTITNINSSSYAVDGVIGNPTIKLFRGETYKFYVSASEASGPDNYPLFIRTQPVSGITDAYDYMSGVINNGDSVGNITFQVPYNAPSRLYYVAENSQDMVGTFDIVNSSTTPLYLIQNTLTYPLTIASSSVAKTDIETVKAYEILTSNKSFIQEEVIEFVNSSWADFVYDETTCRRDVGYIIDGVAKDLLYGGNEESIRAGITYYTIPSEATTIQLAPTTTAVKYAAGMAINLLNGKTYTSPQTDNYTVWDNIRDNKQFVKDETIAFLSSSWTGYDGFNYNEAKCRRDIGYILDAVATDVLYGGNERSIQAGEFYYKYPSQATSTQSEQTITGVRYAAGLIKNLVMNYTFVSPNASSTSAYNLLLDNKELIQNETIQYINVIYPSLKYNQTKCRRDVGYIIDGVATDLLYGGIERGITSGKYYYDIPSIATTQQKKETIAGVKYAKILADYIVTNQILDTPRIITNVEKGIKVSAETNITSTFYGSTTQQNSISSSFSIIEGIIKRGVSAVPSLVAQNSSQQWNTNNPLHVSSTTQIQNGYTTPTEVTTIDRNFEIVNNIIGGGVAAEPVFTSSIVGLIKVTDNLQTTGSTASTAQTSSISSSFAYVARIISGGTGSIQPVTSSTAANIKVTATSLVTSTAGTGAQSASISSSMVTIANIITNGTSAIPTLVSNLVGNVKVTSITQTATSGTLEDVNFISQSISKVTQIIESGNYDGFAKTIYSSAVNSVTVYNTLKANIPFIQAETIAYLSSSWSGFQYDEDKCKRDVGLIVSGAAEDFLFNANSASIVNGQYYYEYPSQATDSQLDQTLDGINYASRLAQKIIQNVTFVNTSGNVASASVLLKNNKEFIKDETIAYMSSSWGSFDYNETTCRRDLGYILDAVNTDLVYGGNERARVAGNYYFLYPSAATGSQLIQTLDAINYASRIAQKIVVGQTFTSADTNKLNASNLLSLNKTFIAEEVVAYVSSSWSGVQYDEVKCKRDVGYIIDAVRTDLVYGGNERTSTAGRFYYLYPSAATIGGVPSATQQLDPTITGIERANALSQKVVVNNVFSKPSQAVLDAKSLAFENRDYIQQNTIEYISDTYPSLNYNTEKCRRDVGFILDNVLTDLVYGGNERSITAGRFYYLYPSQATDSQATETIDSLKYAKELAKLAAIGDIAIERSFDIVSKVIGSGSSAIPALVDNTQKGIKVTSETQYTSSNSATISDKTIVSASFGNVINIVMNGTGSIPTIVTNTNKGVNISGETQTTSSITPQITEINKIGSGFDIVLNVVENGTGSLPTTITNAISATKQTEIAQFITTASIATNLISGSKDSFDIVLDIVEFGTGSTPNLVKSVNGLVKLTDTIQYSSSIAVSSSIAKSVTSSFNAVINILENGTGSLPTITNNTYLNIKTTATSQYISGSSATATEVGLISASISIVTNIIANGTNNTLGNLSLPTSSYTTAVSNDNRWIAYGILKNNLTFIQNETIAYLSSSWSTASYDESKCRRDIGLIISGAMEDLVFNSNSASVVSGKYYYEYPSQAQSAQLNQTLDGVIYASRLAQKLITNTTFVSPAAQTNRAYNLLIDNKQFIQNETIAYISSSWSTKQYDQTTCKRDVGYILDAVATDLKWGGNERSVTAGKFYYQYPSAATGSQIRETVTGVQYAKNLAEKILRGGQFQKVTQNKLQAKQLIYENKDFIADEVIAYVSASWSEFDYNETTCKRDVGYILDAVSTDLVYGGNERAIEAGEFYFRYPSTATNVQLGPTLSGIKYAKGITEKVLQNVTFTTASLSKQTAYDLLYQNKGLIQAETIAYVSASWSGFYYNEASCSRDTGYIVDAVATDILYGGNERVREAGEYYYLYPSQATVGNDGDTGGQLNQTLEGIEYAKGIAQKIVRNTLLTTPTTSELAGYDLLFKNKTLIQKEVIQYVSSSWSGVDGFYYNEASCSRDVGYILDAVATDLKYGGNQRSSKAGEYYYLYPSKATVVGFASPDAQLDQTISGIKFAAGLAQKTISNTLLVTASYYVSSSVELLRNNKTFIQNEAIAYIDAVYPDLVYNRTKCRRDVGYIVDAVSTDLLYGGNERGIIAGDYYYRFPSLATKAVQVKETVDGVNYAKGVAKKVAQNILLSSPVITSNTDGNIKVSGVTQFTSANSGSSAEVTNVSSSFSIVTKIIEGGLTSKPTTVSNVESLVKVTNATQYSSSISASSVEVGVITSSFNLIRDIIYGGANSLPDALVGNFKYGFELTTPTLLHISSVTQTLGAGTYSSQTASISSSYGIVTNIIANGSGSIPTLVENTFGGIKKTGLTPIVSSTGSSDANDTTISASFATILNIIENGTSVAPIYVSNNDSGIKVTQTPQLISGSASSRLQGKLISSSIALVIDVITNGSGSKTIIPSTFPTANSNPKITSAYNLLKGNQQMIIDETIAYMSSSWSGFNYNQAKCERDLSIIISGSAFDLIYGGNSASLVNGKFYLEYPSQANGSQLDQTITALKFASGLAENVVQKITLTHISASLQTSASFVALKANKGFIQSESIAYLSSSWSEFEYSEASCSRDIGYIVDAVATDLLYGGNQRSIVAGRYYYDYPSQATTSQLDPTLDGVRFAKGTALNVVNNVVYTSPSAGNLAAYNLLLNNKRFIQSESISFIDAKYPYLDYSPTKCARDLGYIVDAVATDLLYGGNERSSKAGYFYYKYPSEATGYQIEETIDGIKYAGRLSTSVINSITISEPLVRNNTYNNIKVTNTPQYVSSSYSGSTYEASLISASIAITYNIVENTGSSIPTPTNYTTPSTASNVYYAYNLLKQNITFIQEETIAYLSSSWSGFQYDQTKCKRDVGLIISGAAEDMLFGVASASIVNGKFYFESASFATSSQFNQTLDGIRYASNLAQKVLQNVVFQTASLVVSQSYNLIRNNKSFIQSESLAFVSSSWNEFTYSQATCARDLGYIVDAVSTDLLYGGNERSALAGIFYYKYPSNATSTELEPTVTAVDYAKGLTSKLAQSKTFVTASTIVSSSVTLLRNNRTFIQEETMNYLTASWSTFDYNKDKCRRDVGYILDGVVTDLLYGGNERSVMSGEFYFKYPSKATLLGDGDSVGQLGQTIDGIEYASRIAQKIVGGTTFVTASTAVSASFDLLRKNKKFIAAEVIEYVSSSWSGVYYNQASCSRDVGYLIDAAATDVLYGGQERAITAGTYYYLFPSNATNKGVPSTQNQLDPTITGVRYAGRLSTKIVTNPTFTSPSASAEYGKKLLVANKSFIQKETLLFLSSSWSTLQYNEVSCSRDLGFIIDAVATDLIYGGNERSIEAGSYYYKIPSVAIQPSYTDNGTIGQKKQTVDGINYAKGISEKIVTQTQLVFAGVKRKAAVERLRGSKKELKDKAIGYTNGAFPYLVYNEASCSRDTGLIVDACATDLLYGGNERAIAAASSYYNGQYGSAIAVTRDQLLETLETNRYLRTRAEFIAAGAPLEAFGSLIVATGIDYSYNGAGVTFKALPPNQGGSGVANPAYEITQLGGGRIYFTSGNQDGDFRIGTGLSINQATGTLVGRTFSKSLFSLVTPFSLALQI
jgi:hypothetical protein